MGRKLHDALPTLLNIRELASAGSMENGVSSGGNGHALISLVTGDPAGDGEEWGGSLGQGQKPWVSEFLLDGTGKADPNRGIRISI